LVTDYSSISHDFSISGKPTLHFTPDIDRYERERGLYPRWSETLNVVVDHNALAEALRQICIEDSDPLNPVSG
ncbi:CDP-glycerol glycerophosphotransferase family protein, partial [Vibrio cholerae O1]|nr:CDP-glycerol glycerophosphotransferase family protein [Vibrio cholerae O1]